MRTALIIAALVLTCAGCSTLDPPHFASDTPANTSASYDYKGDLTRDGATDCWYYCL